jgi:cytochrome c oxidase subunit 2
MKRFRSRLVFILNAGLLILGMGQNAIYSQIKKVGNPAPENAPVLTVEISAKKFAFTPSRVEVPANTLVKINLTSLDVEHGFEIESYPHSCVTFKPGKSGNVELYTDKKGEFPFSCCHFCGMGHGKMKGVLVVK